MYYNIKSDTEVEVTYEENFITENNYNYDNYFGISSKLTIPGRVEYDGSTYDVTSVGEYAFPSRWPLQSCGLKNTGTYAIGKSRSGFDI